MDALQEYGSSGEESDDGSLNGRCAAQTAAGDARGGGAPAIGPQALPLLPPAAALLDGSYSPPPAHQQRALEQAALHQGRTRSFPHVAGHFATHVFIKVPTPPHCLAALEQLLRLLQASLPELQPTVHAAASAAGSGSAAAAAAGKPVQPGGGGGGAQPPAGCALAQPEYHISLSRTVPLLRHQIEPLVADLRQRLRQRDTFSIRMAQLAVFCNDDRTRTFLSLAAQGPGGSGGSGSSSGDSSDSDADAQEQQPQQPRYSSQLVALCHAVSGVFAAHGLPRFYGDPKPHASVAWLLGDQQQQLEEALAALEVRAGAARLAAQAWQLQPDAIVCKSGQREQLVWQAAGE